MDEKRSLIDAEARADDRPDMSAPQPHAAGKGRKLTILVLIAGVLGFLHLPYGSLRPCQSTSGLRTYAGESLEWSVCGSVEGRDLECSSMDVPMDQFDRANSEDKTFSIPLARLRGKDATQNLVVNPGGPGGGGVDYLHRAGSNLRTIVGEDYHILSFDPRGIGESRPAAACYPNDELRRSKFITRGADPIAYSSLLAPWADNHAQACRDTMGEHGRYINTPQTAADMNSILDAVGQDQMVYWGFSYGSLLGQTYATMYPERSERVIIDGIVDEFLWYDDLVLATDFADTARVLDGFFNECVNAGEICPLHSFAPSVDVLKQNVTDFLHSLAEDPLSVYVNSTSYGTIDFASMWFEVIFPAMYKGQNWFNLASSIADLMQGNGTVAFHKYISKIEPPGDAYNIVISNDARSGKDHFPQSRVELMDLLKPLMTSSPFGSRSMPEHFVRSKWRIPKTHQYVPRRGVKTRHPLLILSTTFDPICPIVNARSARDAFVDSRLLEVKGYGHCSTAVKSTCMAHHIRAYLGEGTLPAKDSKCEADGPYFVKPEEVRQMLMSDDSSQSESETERIHAAQMGLADALAAVNFR